MVQRRDTRVTAGVGVILTIDGQPGPCMTRNISRGGLFAVTQRVAPVGTMVDLEVVHRGVRLRAKARVANQNEEGMGLTFVLVDDQFRAAVRGLMDELVAAQAGASVDDPESFDDQEIRGAPRVSWGMGEEGSWWKFWEKKQFRVDVADMNLDGAAVSSDAAPPVGETIIFYLEDHLDQSGEPLACSAEVVRHTESGFAVRFLSPSIQFRRAISQYRRAKFRRG